MLQAARNVSAALSPRDIYAIADAAGMSADEVAELLARTGRAAPDVLSSPAPSDLLRRSLQESIEPVRRGAIDVPILRGPSPSSEMGAALAHSGQANTGRQQLLGALPGSHPAESAAFRPWSDEVYQISDELGAPPAQVQAWLHMAEEPAGMEAAAFNFGMRAGAPPEHAYVVGLSLLGAGGVAANIAAAPAPGSEETNQLATAALWR